MAFAIVPNCGGSGEKRLSCFTEHALACAENPSQRLLDQITEKPTADLLKRYLKDRLGSTFPKRADLIGEMKLEFAFTGATYETLTNPTFQVGVRKPYACGDFDKPLYEFDAARATHERLPL